MSSAITPVSGAPTAQLRSGQKPQTPRLCARPEPPLVRSTINLIGKGEGRLRLAIRVVIGALASQACQVSSSRTCHHEPWCLQAVALHSRAALEGKTAHAVPDPATN